MQDPNIGRILSNRYQLVELLGQGAMGRVYGAKDVLLGGVPVAAKFLAQTLLNQKMRDRFEREATTCALLGQRSSHIVRVTDYGVDEDEIPFYIMEYLKGESLSEIITRQPITLPRFLSLIRQICLGLQCAHQGIPIGKEIYPIVHRDIKPSNILVINDESLGEWAKVLDFGIAKILQEDGGQTNCFMGTLAYSSPEQMEGHELDGRSDIYSLGVMMFQMLTGKMPLHADTHTFGGWYKAHHYQPPRSLETANASIKVPKALESLVMSCLEKAPSDRPQNIGEVLKALEPLEQRFSPGRQFAQRIGEVLQQKNVNTVNPPRETVLTPEKICQLASWPSNKPIAEIVFSSPIRTSKDVLATLWVMLKRQEVEKRLRIIPYNRFVFMPEPHPTMLWLTVLYSPEHGPRWLPCYLDLKTSHGQQMVTLLSEAEQYYVLLFSKEEPQRCAHVLKPIIKAAQQKELEDWLALAKISSASPVSQFNFTKGFLKDALDKQLKPQIMRTLETMYGDAQSATELLDLS